MRLLLVQPPTIKTASHYDKLFILEPLALEYVAAGLMDEHDIEIFDMRVDKDYTLKSKIEDFNPDVIGFTSLTVNVNTVIRLSQEVKKNYPNIVILIGGHHASVSAKDFYKPSIDAIMIGEGIETMKQYLYTLQYGGDIEQIDGMAFNKNGEFIRNKNRAYPALESFRFPNRNLTKKYRHMYFTEEYKPLATIRTSKGCPHRCKFCSLWKESGGKYMKREIERIVEELKQIEEPYVFFADDESFIDMNYMDLLAEEIKKSGIKKKYYTFVRSDTFIKHTDLMRKWAEIGLSKVHMGIESHRSSDLDNWNKKNTSVNNVRAVEIAHEMGIKVTATIIISQDFVEQDFDDMLEFSNTLNFDSIMYTVLTPLPGTELYDEVEDQMISKNYDLFDMSHTLLPTKLELHRFYNEYANLYLRSTKNSHKEKVHGEYSKTDLKDLYFNIKKAYLDH